MPKLDVAPMRRMLADAISDGEFDTDQELYIVSDAAELVGRHVNTLKRWAHNGGPTPSYVMSIGNLKAGIYTEDDIETCKEYGSHQRTGPKPGTVRSTKAKSVKKTARPKITRADGKRGKVVYTGKKAAVAKVGIRKVAVPGKVKTKKRR